MVAKYHTMFSQGLDALKRGDLPNALSCMRKYAETSLRKDVHDRILSFITKMETCRIHIDRCESLVRERAFQRAADELGLASDMFTVERWDAQRAWLLECHAMLQQADDETQWKTRADLLVRVEPFAALHAALRADHDARGAELLPLDATHRLRRALLYKLFPHQRDGVRWMLQKVQEGCGGLLADDMGMGKTIQCCTLMHLLVQEPSERALVVVTASSVDGWMRELANVFEGDRVCALTSRTTDKHSALACLHSGVCVTTYDTLKDNARLFVGLEWKLLFVDEAHRMKNPKTRNSAVLWSVRCRHRFLITATPIQNSTMEFYHLMNFVKPDVLGTPDYFAEYFQDPIETSQRSTDAEARRRGREAQQRLMRVTHTYYLRREKSGMLDLPNKTDMIVWIKLSAAQETLYRTFTDSSSMQQLAQDKRNTLSIITFLKMICMHPRLLRDTSISSFLDADMRDGDDAAADITTLVRESGKMTALSRLLPGLRQAGHRTLVFSRSLKVLDMVGRLLRALDMDFIRVDGDTAPADRQALVDRFNRDPTIHVCTLSIGAGAEALTLTGADRVVLLEPSWNPSTDSQAMDRAYRIGQTRDVVVYRFITCASIEDKMLARQVFKEGIIHQTMKRKWSTPYFEAAQLRELVQLSPDVCQSPSIQQFRAKIPAALEQTQHTRQVADLAGDAVIGTGHFDRLFGTDVVETITPPERVEHIDPQHAQQALKRRRADAPDAPAAKFAQAPSAPATKVAQISPAESVAPATSLAKISPADTIGTFDSTPRTRLSVGSAPQKRNSFQLVLI